MLYRGSQSEAPSLQHKRKGRESVGREHPGAGVSSWRGTCSADQTENVKGEVGDKVPTVAVIGQ